MSGPLSKPYSPDVEAFHASITVLARWLIAEGGTAEELLDAIEKPWRWEPEANAAQALEEATRGWGD